jgi:preprotein translocase subunit Sec61beta
MAKKTQGPGIQASAGLIRYFDAEETSSVKIPPIAVMLFGVVTGVALILMRALIEL